MAQKADVIKDKITHPLYRLFSKPLEDNDSKISFFLNTLNENYDAWKNQYLQTPEKLAAFKEMLSNVLTDISWNDFAIATKTISPILALDKRDDLKESLLAKSRE